MSRRMFDGLEDVPETPSVFKDALCKGMDTEFFFPLKGAISEPKKVCAECPVQMECLVYAIENRIEFGLWGGVSQRQRVRLHKTRDYDEWVPKKCVPAACRKLFIGARKQICCSKKCQQVLRDEIERQKRLEKKNGIIS